jgi:hypothetical protein
VESLSAWNLDVANERNTAVVDNIGGLVSFTLGWKRPYLAENMTITVGRV